MHRHIVNENICEAYGLEVEDSGHLFWRYVKAQEVWVASGLVGVLRSSQEYQFANYIPTQPRSDSEVYWSPPKPPWFKVNVEGAVFSSLKSVGVGIVIWDHCGQVAAAMSRSLDVPLGPLETQAKAMEEAILFAKDTGFHDVIF
ncbi:hypothetical protein RGQ29_007697 [Quercus rubra]|uniref:RNase H type-1 domain-containing protein n=1 Tax=Quercus rubra TaxID=3512 RepID=A0AAN7I7M4_QUERU|nr:hypothetical protein RGQ29_007697 [Quercus rubra]